MYDVRLKKTFDYKVIEEYNELEGGIKVLEVKEASMTIKSLALVAEGH